MIGRSVKKYLEDDQPDPPKLIRVEVINYYDNKGRDYVFWQADAKIEVEYQDGGKTLKIFISK